MAVPYTFANSTSAIPLSQLDNNFATAITLGNTAIQLGNTVTTLNNMTMANVTISSVSTPISASQGGTGLTNAGTNGNVLTSNGTAWVSQAPSAATGNVTIGNTTINLGGTATTIGNLTLTNATLSSLASPVTASQGGTGATTLTSNNVLIGNGTGSVAFVAPGTSGNVLTSNGTVWASTAPAGSSPWVYISTTTASTSSSVEVTGMNATYDFYMITIQNMSVSTSGTNFWAQLYLDGTKQTGANYAYVDGTLQTAWTANGYNNGTDNRIYVAPSTEVDASADYEFIVYCPNVNTTTYPKGFWGTGTRLRNTRPTQYFFSGLYNTTGSKLTGVSFFMQSGTINTGSFRLYGLKNS